MWWQRVGNMLYDGGLARTCSAGYSDNGHIIVWFLFTVSNTFNRCFGPIHFPFWAKTKCILRQNALHFAAKRILFCGKTHSILRQNAFSLRRYFISLMA
jgi:hypothetical protein